MSFKRFSKSQFSVCSVFGIAFNPTNEFPIVAPNPISSPTVIISQKIIGINPGNPFKEYPPSSFGSPNV